MKRTCFNLAAGVAFAALLSRADCLRLGLCL